MKRTSKVKEYWTFIRLKTSTNLIITTFEANQML